MIKSWHCRSTVLELVPENSSPETLSLNQFIPVRLTIVIKKFSGVELSAFRRSTFKKKLKIQMSVWVHCNNIIRTQVCQDLICNVIIGIMSFLTDVLLFIWNLTFVTVLGNDLPNFVESIVINQYVLNFNTASYWILTRTSDWPMLPSGICCITR